MKFLLERHLAHEHEDRESSELSGYQLALDTEAGDFPQVESSAPAAHSGARKIGLVIGLLGFATLSVGDGISKAVVQDWNALLLAATRYSIGALGWGLILFVREGRRAIAFPRPWLQLGRGLCIAVATASFFSSLFVMPLAIATSILFLGPILTALISSWFLKEPPGLAVWIAILLSILGVMLVLQPDFSELGFLVILPIIAAIATSGLVIFNRLAGGAGSVIQMQFTLAAAGAPLMTLIAIGGAMTGIPELALSFPSATVLLGAMAIAVVASMGHLLIYMATTYLPAANVAPLSYVQLLVALLIGLGVYGHFPVAIELGGAALIVLSGLLIWWDQNSKPVR